MEMKRILLLAALPAALLIASCGNQADEDAEAFCKCVEEEADSCEEDMEKLEEAFKKDNDRYEAFKKAATKKCPDAKRIIERMN
jgi:protein involved in sex pheromone biosynthesis